MKKRVGLVLLLITVMAGMAFAQAVGTRLQFDKDERPNGDWPLPECFEVISVVKTKSGFALTYKVLDDVESTVVRASVGFSEGNIRDWSCSDNKESWISKGKTYTINITQPKWGEGTIQYVTILFDDIKMKGGSKGRSSAPKAPKKNWVDRLFPPLQL